MAQAGAKVVVNDIGVSLTGDNLSARQGAVRRPMSSTRSVAAGGMAVANFDSAWPLTTAPAAAWSRHRRIRTHRRRGQQRRQSARPRVPQDERRGMAPGARRAPQRLVLHEPRRRALLPRTGIRRVRAHDVHLRPDREFRPGQLCGGQAGHRGLVEIHRAGHGALQRALQLHRAVCLEPHDQLHSGGNRRREGARRKAEENGGRQSRAHGRLSRQRRGQRDHRADLRRARQRDHADEPAAAAAHRAPRRRLDPRTHCRDRRACHAQALLCVGAFARRDRLGSDLGPRPWTMQP